MKAIIRADGSPAIGMGHVMRCLTLAGELELAGADVLFLSRNFSEGVARTVQSAGIALVSTSSALTPVEDLDATIRAARSFKAGTVIADGYLFDEAYFNGIIGAGLRLVIIDDLADRPMPADLLLNQNVDATPERYAGLVRPDTKLLLGTRYCLVRKEFRARRKIGRVTRKDVREVIVTLGGSDPDNHSLKAIRAIESVDADFNVTLVLGAANPNIAAVRSFVASSVKREVRVVVGAGNMADLIGRADLGITASGTTSYETACLGLPTITVSIAENQEGVARMMGEMGVSVYLGRAPEVDESAIRAAFVSLLKDTPGRSGMSGKGMSLIDGDGAMRVAEEVLVL